MTTFHRVSFYSSSQRLTAPRDVSQQTPLLFIQHSASLSMAKRNPGSNLSHQDRVRGGEASASMQKRDDHGRFEGKGATRRFWDKITGE